MLRKLLLFAGACVFTLSAQSQTMSVTPGYCFNSVPGNTANAHPSFSAGITSYSWAVAGPNCAGAVLATAPTGTAATLQYLCCGVQTISCMGYNGSTLVFTNTMTINIGCAPMPTIGSTSNFLSCPGDQDTLSASGAQTYTWLPGNFTNNSIGVNPTSTTCYTLFGTSAQGCVGSVVRCVTVNPVPNVSIQAPSIVCPLSPVTLTASGATSYSWAPAGGPGQNTNMYTMNISSGPCFTVYGTSLGCTGVATTCISSYSMPSISVLYDTTNLCMGSSITMTASGMSNYLWSNGATTATVNALPIGPVVYMVKGHDSNGCSDSTYINLNPKSNCAIVWPGDANSDGVVNSTDVLELGLYNAQTGAVRLPGGNAYTGQFATAWTGTGSNGQNRAHVDCNGDGVVNSSDTLAIYNNFALTHSFRTSAGAGSANEISLVPDYGFTGEWKKMNILIGEAEDEIADIYGISFELQYDAAFVESDKVHVRYPQSFLNSEEKNIPFRRKVPGSDLINCVTVRVDGNNVTGHGIIGEFLFKPLQGKTGIMNISVDNVMIIDQNGQSSTLSSSAGIYDMSVGLAEHKGFAGQVGFFPNPANDKLHIYSSADGTVGYTVTDLTGRTVATGEFEHAADVDLTALSSGAYLVIFKTGQQTETKRLLIRD